MSEEKNYNMVRLKGKVVDVGELKTFASGFECQDLVIDTTTNAEYPCPVPITFKKDKIDMIRNLMVDEQVDVRAWVRGREWKDKYFAGLDVFKVDVIRDEQPAEQPVNEGDLPPADRDNIPF